MRPVQPLVAVISSAILLRDEYMIDALELTEPHP